MIAIQILWVNLATDGLPALALAVDPAAPDIMRRKPRPRNQTIFTRPVVVLMVLGGVWSAVVNLGIFSWALGAGKSLIEAQCLVFMTINILEFFAAFSFRSDRLSLRQIGPFKNRWLMGAVAISLGMTLPLLYIPAAREVFHTYPLGLADWGIVIAASATMMGVLELTKFVIRRVDARLEARQVVYKAE